MGREIKFRAWIRAGEWEEPDEMQQKYVMLYGDELAFEEYLPINDLLARVEHLMQYTGLKDSKGYEIYEGDILRFVNPEAAKYPFEVFWDEGNLQWAVRTKRHGTGDLAGGDFREGDMLTNAKVVGNIYETPALVA